MIKGKYQDLHKIIAIEYATDLINIIAELGVKIENTENQIQAISNNIKNDLRKNLPNIELFRCHSAVQRMNVINRCQLLDLVELLEIMNPDNLKAALQREFQLTCSIIETLVLSPSQKQKLVAIRKSSLVFNKLWEPFAEYFDQLSKIKPLIMKIFEFQTQPHCKEDIQLYTSNPLVGNWILAVKKHPRYHSEFKKYVSHLKSSQIY